MTDSSLLAKIYAEKKPLLESFAAALHDEMSVAMDEAGIALGFPIQARVKSEQSIAEKLDRKVLSVAEVEKLPDLVGLRIIVLYTRDLKRVIDALSQFKITPPDDVSLRLREDQFGYNSIHVELRMPENWLSVPRLKKFGGLYAEIQVRTLAQHLWASASHDLQYKREKSVPAPVRRAISRVSALLETVDLEFERVLAERALYVDKLQNEPVAPETPLDVESLKVVLRSLWPHRRESWQTISDLLQELNGFGINTAEKLTDLIDAERKFTEKLDQHYVQRVRDGDLTDEDDTNWMVEHDTYFSPIGLARVALEKRFGDEYLQKTKIMNLIPADFDTEDFHS